MSIGIRRDVFHAIADPTRRQIIQLISGKSMNLSSIAEHFDISRPGISQQIKILTECGLIHIKQVGRERYCEAKLEKLYEISSWVDQYQEFWEARLDKIDDVLSHLQKKSRHKRKK